MPEDSYSALEALVGHAERVLTDLGLHYRAVALCTGDIGFGAAKCYDLEVWAPGVRVWLELSEDQRLKAEEALPGYAREHGEYMRLPANYLNIGEFEAYRERLNEDAERTIYLLAEYFAGTRAWDRDMRDSFGLPPDNPRCTVAPDILQRARLLAETLRAAA